MKVNMPQGLDRSGPSPLGRGANGPWENRTAAMLERGRHEPPERFGARVVAGHLNATYSVQRALHPEHPGVDHLVIRRHDEQNVTASWEELQRIKNRLCPDGRDRYAIEVYPPTLREVVEYPLRHLFVMPVGWWPPVNLHDAEPGYVPT